MLVLVVVLTVFGLAMLLSASEYNGRVRFGDSAYYFKKQLFAAALGLGIMYLIMNLDYHFFVKLAPVAYLVSVVLSIAVLFVGQEINGSRRWLNLGPLSFQPSEFAKVAVILFLTWQIDRWKKKTDSLWFMFRTMLTLLPIVGIVGIQQSEYCPYYSGNWCGTDFCFKFQISAFYRSGSTGNRLCNYLSGCRELSSGTSGNLAKSGKV